MFPIPHTSGTLKLAVHLAEIQPKKTFPGARKWLRQGEQSAWSSCVFCGVSGSKRKGLLSPLHIPQEVAGIQAAFEPLHCRLP